MKINREKINKSSVINGLKFVAENQHLSNKELRDGLARIGCDFTLEEWERRFPLARYSKLFNGMRRARLSCGACIIANLYDDAPNIRGYINDRFLSVDDKWSIYHYVRRATHDKNYKKANINN